MGLVVGFVRIGSFSLAFVHCRRCHCLRLSVDRIRSGGPVVCAGWLLMHQGYRRFALLLEVVTLSDS